MKKIDLHIHTIATISDSKFSFSIDTFKRYVSEARLDAVAVTNHDVFDADQYREIQKALSITVFPGIEINVDMGHVLIIASPSTIGDFEVRSREVSKKITKIGDSISVEELRKIYGNLDDYLVIPHYEKDPAITGSTLEKLRPHICAGEVDSAKKFIRTLKDVDKLTPVLFSDSRMKDGVVTIPTRQTFVHCGELTVGSLKICLRDKTKVSLSEKDGNKLWQVLGNGQLISTGLNVLLGARSSGKTHTLNEINNNVDNVKYIQQFQLVQQSESAFEKDFNSNVAKKRSALADQYLLGFKRLVDNIADVSLTANDRLVGRYIETLLKAAEDADRHDAFSKSAMFNEVEFSTESATTLHELIGSVRQVIENEEFRPIIEKHVDISALKRLACELIELLRARDLQHRKREFVNSLVREIRKGLKLRTAAVQIEDVDLYRVALDLKRVTRFSEIVQFLKREAVIFNEQIQGFRVEVRKGPYTGAMEIKDASGLKTAFSEAFQKYGTPYDYLQKLLGNEAIPRAELYKLFAKISYRILNREGYEVSGGERSEFRLLQEIADAQNYDVLLVDEPESSFDNIFLKSDVNQILKDIAKTMPVVVVTHNNTVGASVGADYLLYTRREIVDGKVTYGIYSGYAGDKTLSTNDGRSINSHEIWMNSLEAGDDAYESRRKMYEATKN